MKLFAPLKYFVFVLAALLMMQNVCNAAAAAETLRIKGLKSKVTVAYDKFGVPTIKADNSGDLFFAQGYIQARDRLWQMDMNRRQINGRMAELRGKHFINHDFNSYRTGIPQVAEEIWRTAGPYEKKLIQAYTDGINAYITALKTPPPEYAEIGGKPEPWRPADSMAIARGIGWVMSSDLGIEIAVGLLSKQLGKTATMKMLPIHPLDPITVLGSAQKKADAGISGARFTRNYFDYSAESFPEALFGNGAPPALEGILFAPGGEVFPRLASNNWVVSGKRTKDGFPLLSNDTHTGFSQPCMWYEVHLVSPEFDTVGLTTPGAPGIVIGHNKYVAWGVTTGRFDVTDVYVEKLDPANPDTHYIFKGESLPFKVENIEIKYSTPEGMKSETRKLLHTVHGPVVYENDRPRTVLSYRWTGHVPTHEEKASIGFMKAKNIAEFKKALDSYEAGAMNFVCADTSGNILFRAQGRVPIRKGTPFLPLDGSSGKYEWTGFIPYDKLPQGANPPAGFYVSANNRQTDENYPYYLGVFYDKGYRARRIDDLIRKSGKMTFNRMREIQADVYSLPAERLTPILFAGADAHPEILTPSAKTALDLLKKWDFFERVNAIEPSIFYKWIKFCFMDTFKDDIQGDVLGNMARSEVFFPILLSAKPLPINFFDDKTTPDVTETKDMIVARALNDAVAELETQLGADSRKWRWGAIHKVTFGHDLGGKYNVGPFEADGGMDTVNVADFGINGGDFNFGHGPSMRMTVELKPNAVKGENIIAGGQSADQADPHYSDQASLWLDKKTRLMTFYSADVKRNTENILILAP